MVGAEGQITMSNSVNSFLHAAAGERPYRIHIDPANDGSEEVSLVADHIRSEFLSRIGLEDLLLHPRSRRRFAQS